MKTARLAAHVSALLVSVLIFSACSAKRVYPEASLGWHSPSFSIIFGRIQRVAGATPDSPQVWIIRFGDGRDAYNGELALALPDESGPASRTPWYTGYSGGEHVEIHGHLLEQQTTDAFNGRWYVVDSIRMWSDYR